MRRTVHHTGNSTLDSSTIIKTNFPRWLEEFSEYEFEKRKLWDLIKYRIRQVSIRFSKKKAKEKRIVFSLLEKQLKYAELQVSEFPSEENLTNLEMIKQQLDREYEIKIKGNIFRSKAKWYEEGENNSKFFLNLEKNK